VEGNVVPITVLRAVEMRASKPVCAKKTQPVAPLAGIKSVRITPVINVRVVAVTGCVDRVKTLAHALRTVQVFVVEMVSVMRTKPAELVWGIAELAVALVVSPMKPRVVRIRL